MPPNVLLVVFDCVRARSTSLHGADRLTTPNVESFAADATVHAAARAAAPWTLPSHATMFTGRSPADHGANTLGDAVDGPTTFEFLAAQGYNTGMFTENPFLSRLDTGLRAGFDHVHPVYNVRYPDALGPQEYDLSPRGALRYAADCARHDQPLRSLVNGVVPVLQRYGVLERLYHRRVNEARYFTRGLVDWARGRQGPWAACLNLVDAHAPYRPVREFNRYASETAADRVEAAVDTDAYLDAATADPAVADRARDLYQGAVSQVDAYVGRVLDALRDDGQLDETLVVVTADHGETFGYPHEVTGDPLHLHRDGLNEEHLAVPLVTKAPGQREGRVESGLATNARFDAVVRAAVDGERAGFGVDDHVATYRYAGNHNRGHPHEGEPVHAAYAPDPNSDRLRKLLVDPHGVRRTLVSPDGTERTPVEDADWPALRDAVPSEVADAAAEADVSAARSRLEDLGYL